MPVYLEDPSVLTKERLKSELLAHNVELPGGNPPKDVYVQLYLKTLTAQNKRHGPDTALDAFSSDEELPPVVSRRSRSSGRKSEAVVEQLDLALLTDEGLRDQLLKHGVDAGPIVASTRKLYERKLQKLLDNGPVLSEQLKHNGSGEAELYSDREDEVTAAPDPEPDPDLDPEPDPEPVPVLKEPVRSHGNHTAQTHSSSQHSTRDPVTLHEGATERREELVPKVARRSKRLSLRMVSEALRPLLTQQEFYRRPHSPVRGPPPTSSRPAPVPVAPGSSSRPAQVAVAPVSSSSPAQGDPAPVAPDSSSRPAPAPGSSSRPAPSLVAPGSSFRPAPARGSSSRPAQENSDVRPPPLDSLTFISRCNISPIKRPASVSVPGRVSTAAVEKITVEQPPEENLLHTEHNLFTGPTATCRRPIRGAAGRPTMPTDQHHNPDYTSRTTSSSFLSHTESCRRINHSTPSSTAPAPSDASSAPSNASSTPFTSRCASGAPSACQAKAGGMSWWKKLLLLAVLALFLFFVYQAMEINSTNPFEESKAVSGSTA